MKIYYPILLFSLLSVAAQDFAFIDDRAEVLPSDFQSELEARLEDYRARTGKTIQLFFSHSPPQDFSNADATLVVDMNQRRVLLHPSFEARAEIIHKITPLLKKGDFSRAATVAFEQIALALDGPVEVPVVPVAVAEVKKSRAALPEAVSLVALILLLCLIGRGLVPKAPSIFVARWKGKGALKLDSEEIESAQTRAGVVFINLARSHFYPVAHLRLCALFGLATPLLFSALGTLLPLPFPPVTSILPALLLGYGLGFKANFKKMFSTSAELDDRVRGRALNFLCQNARPHLIISTLERRLALALPPDKLEKAGPVQCRLLLKRITQDMKNQGTEKALLSGIEALGTLLAEEAPLAQALGEKDKPV